MKSMNSWAKVMKLGNKLGFEFWGLDWKITIYRNGVLIAKDANFKETKAIILKANLA